MFYVSIVHPELESNAIKDVFCDENDSFRQYLYSCKFIYLLSRFMLNWKHYPIEHDMCLKYIWTT